MVDKLLVQGRLALIAAHLEQLIALAGIPRETFLGDQHKVAAAESYLRRSLEAVFDVGRHLLAKSGGVDLATEYKSIARGLGQKQIVSQDLSEILVKMAGYRNRLVHLYHVVSDQELYEILQSDLEDLRGFVREVRAFLQAL